MFTKTMPGRHWIIAKNLITGDYKILPWWDEVYYSPKESWMGNYYMASEYRDPQWAQVGLYESEEEAQGALAVILQS